MADSIDEIFSSTNKYAQLYKHLEKQYVLDKQALDNPYKIFYGLPFYRFDLSPKEHLDLYDKTKCRCCWNHFVGLPEKHGKKMPLFPYQKVLFEDFEKTYNGESDQKLFAVLKATGLGITEFSIRIMGWMATTSNIYRGQRFAIIAGIRMDISEEIIRRMIKLFDRFPFLNIKRHRSKTLINGVMIEGYPAENVDSMRAYDNLAFILVDEADFFQKSKQKEIRTVVERYRAKTNPYIYLVSTPGKPYGMFYEIFSQKPEDSIYKQYRFNYEWGLGTIFTKKEISEQKKTPAFQQEYNLQFGGTNGNLFSMKSIQRNIYTEAQAQKIGFTPYYNWKAIPDDHNTGEGEYFHRSIGVDLGFGKDPGNNIGSYTGITVLQERNRRIEVMFVTELIQPEWDEIMNIIAVLTHNTNAEKVFIDGSNPPFIMGLKEIFGEYTKYGKFTKEELDKKIFSGNMRVCPIAFNSMSKFMMYDMKEYVDKGLLVIHENQHNIIDCLKSAYVINEKLDKERTAHDDIFDSTRLALLNYDIEPIKTTPKIVR